MKLLSSSEEALIRDSWNLVVPDLQRHSVNYYISMFINYPEWQNRFFYRLKGQSLNQIRANPVLVAHSSHVFHVISNLIDNLGNADVVAEGVKKIARTHWPLKIYGPEMSAGLELLLDYMKAAFGEKINDNCAKAWGKIFAVMSDVIISEQKRLADEGLYTNEPSEKKDVIDSNNSNTPNNDKQISVTCNIV